MNTINKGFTKPITRPVKVLQYGEGNFLRGFVDYMIDIANDEGVFEGNIAIVKPIAYGSLEDLHRQECQYSVSLRGLEGGKPRVTNRIITSITKALGTYEDYEEYMGYAGLESLRFIVSNTTEAGIVYDESDSYEDKPPKSFPAKLTKLLHERYSYFNGDKNKGLIILPCELIENNGVALRECVNNYIKSWRLGIEFHNWIMECCVFCNTLVDRIITGYPHDQAEEYWHKAGYKDKLIVCGELFGLWVIESQVDISNEFPLDKAGLPLIFTKDIKPYREQKVRILNGAHTSFVAASFLSGNNTVKESMDDQLIRSYVMKTIFDEVIPNLTLARNQLEDFALKVIERFENPFIKHSLLSISLNSVSKWKSRCLPSFVDYYAANGKLPVYLTFSLAALISLYRGKLTNNDGLVGYREGIEYRIMDDQQVMEFFDGSENRDDMELAQGFLKNEDFLGEDMTKYPGILDTICNHLQQIRKYGMRRALEDFVSANRMEG